MKEVALNYVQFGLKITILKVPGIPVYLLTFIILERSPASANSSTIFSSLFSMKEDKYLITFK